MSDSRTSEIHVWLDELAGWQDFAPKLHDLLLDLEAGRKRIVEAGALIITPDEDGTWPEWALEAGKSYRVERNSDGEAILKTGLPSRHILDALRDATPDGSEL